MERHSASEAERLEWLETKGLVLRAAVEDVGLPWTDVVEPRPEEVRS